MADEFAGLPHGQAWTGPEPHLVAAAVALSAGRPAASTSAAAGHAQNATHAFAPVLAAGSGAPERVRVQAWLVDAQLGYRHAHGDRARGCGSLARALRLAEPEKLRLPRRGGPPGPSA